MLPADLIAALDTVAATPRLLVTSDFDGTLSPIVNNPADARALPAGSAALLDLAALPDTFVALVSGRALDVLRGRDWPTRPRSAGPPRRPPPSGPTGTTWRSAGTAPAPTSQPWCAS